MASLLYSKITLYLLMVTTYKITLTQGSVAITGAAVKWLRDNLNVISRASEIGKICIFTQLNEFLVKAQYWQLA